MNYDTDITIDETALDVEWLEQPRLMLKYARYAAECKKAVDQAKEKLELVCSQIDKNIRANPSDYGLVKPTDTAVKATIPLDEEYQEANKELIEAKFEADLAMNAVYAFNARKDALQNLVTLHGQRYFAGPKVPRDLTWERTEHDQKVNAGIADKLNRKPNKFQRK